MMLARRSLLVVPFATAACGGSVAPRAEFPPLHYDYLTPLGLNVATIDTVMRVFAPGTQGEVTQQTPIDLLAALQQMGADRLKAYGTSGKAEYVVTEASLYQRVGGYEGTLGVEVDIYPAGSSQRAAYAEARVFRRVNIDDDDRGTLYDLEKQLLDALNVELEFQVRRNLKDWLVAAPSGVPAPVNAQPLPPPS